MSSGRPYARPHRASTSRIRSYRAGALLLSVGLLVLLELLMRAVGVAPLSRAEWASHHHLISLERYFGQFEEHFVRIGEDPPPGTCATSPLLTSTGDSRRDTMQRATFSCEPVQGSYRVMVLGESSIQGFGLPENSTIPALLERALSTSSAAKIEVINGGVGGYNTLQIRRMVSEIWPLKPDLIIIYAGHNDFNYYPAVDAARRAQPFKLFLRETGDRLALWRATRQVFQGVGLVPGVGNASDKWLSDPKDRTGRPSAARSSEIPLYTDYFSQTREISRQHRAWKDIVGMYQENLSSIAIDARDRGIRTLLVTPVSAITIPPIHSFHWRTLSRKELRRFHEILSILDGPIPPSNRAELLREALAIDDSYSAIRVHEARLAEREGRQDDAWRAWNAAQDSSPPTHSIRAPPRFGELVLELGRELEVPALDLRPPVDRWPGDGGAGTQHHFNDDLHFSTRGAEWAASSISKFLIHEGLLHSPGP